MVRLRTRSNSHLTRYRMRYRVDPSTWSAWSSWSDVEFWSLHTTMYDVAADRSVRIHPVDHAKLIWDGIRFPQSAYDPSAPWYVEEYELSSPEYVTVAGGVSLFQFTPDPSSSLLGDLGDASFDAMYPQVPQEVDIANFLIDFKEIGSLIPKLENAMVKTVSGGFLTYSFGWAPLIGDLRKLGKLSSTVAKRLAYLRRTRGKVTRLGFSSSFSYEGPSVITIGPQRFTVKSADCRYTCGGYLFHMLDRLGGIEGELRAFSAALGLNNPSAVVWERIPFSFVADWFARTKSLSDSFLLNPFPGEWRIYDLSHSLKQRVEVTVEGTGYSLAPFKNAVLGTLVVERYIRRPGLPVSSAVFHAEGLSSQQLALATALIAGAGSK